MLRRRRIREVDGIDADAARDRIAPKRGVKHGVAGAARKAVIARAARDRVVVIRTDNIREAGQRIRTPTGRQTRCQIHGYRTGRVRKINGVGARTARQRIVAGRGIKEVVPIPGRYLVISRTTVNRVIGYIGNIINGHVREVSRDARPHDGARLYIKRQRLRSIRDGSCKRINATSPTVKRVIRAPAVKIKIIIPRTAGHAYIGTFEVIPITTISRHNNRANDRYNAITIIRTDKVRKIVHGA